MRNDKRLTVFLSSEFAKEGIHEVPRGFDYTLKAQLSAELSDLGMASLAFLTKTDCFSGGRDVECVRKTLQG
jgi:hypothetical protein